MKKLEYIKITEDDYFMGLARTQSGLSTDLRRPIGVVIVNKQNNIIGRGSNQATIKWKWLINWHKTHCIRKMIGIKKHILYWICSGCALYRNHAEVRAINNISTVTNTSKDLYIYGHKICCEKCLDKMIKIGINKIYTL